MTEISRRKFLAGVSAIAVAGATRPSYLARVIAQYPPLPMPLDWSLSVAALERYNGLGYCFGVAGMEIRS